MVQTEPPELWRRPKRMGDRPTRRSNGCRRTRVGWGQGSRGRGRETLLFTTLAWARLASFLVSSFVARRVGSTAGTAVVEELGSTAGVSLALQDLRFTASWGLAVNDLEFTASWSLATDDLGATASLSLAVESLAFTAGLDMGFVVSARLRALSAAASAGGGSSRCLSYGTAFLWRASTMPRCEKEFHASSRFVKSRNTSSVRNLETAKLHGSGYMQTPTRKCVFGHFCISGDIREVHLYL